MSGALFKSLVIVAVVALLAATVVYAQANPADSIHACVDQNGHVRIVGAGDTCKNQESSLVWNVQGPPGPAGGGGGLTVVDSNQVQVGSLIGSDAVARKVGNDWLLFQNVSPAGLSNFGTTYWYTDPDCSGTPYLQNNGMLRIAWVGGTTAVYPADPIGSVDFYASQSFTPPSTFGDCLPNFFGGVQTLIAGPATSVELPAFVPPFSIGN